MSFFNPNLKVWENPVKWCLLKFLSFIYEGLIRGWLLIYRIGLKSPVRVDCPVISVGNITAGGTGKTPMIDWLLSYLQKRDVVASVLTRGYKAKKTKDLQILSQENERLGNWEQFGDEPWMLFRNHPNVRIYISSNRTRSAEIAQKQSNILLLDDGMQHLKLDRDLNIVLVDGTMNFGNSHILPLGPLREPLQGLDRADVILFTKTNLIDDDRPDDRMKEIIPGNIPCFKSEFIPKYFVSSKEDQVFPIDSFSEKTCVLFSGIGNPMAFEKLIQSLGLKIVDHLKLVDHFDYSKSSLIELNLFFRKFRTDYIICTEKDWVKLEAFKDDLPEILRLKVTMEPDVAFVTFLDNWIKEQGFE